MAVVHVPLAVGEWWAWVYDAACQQLLGQGVETVEDIDKLGPFTVHLHPADADPRFLSPNGWPGGYQYRQKIWTIPVVLTPTVRQGQVRVRPR